MGHEKKYLTIILTLALTAYIIIISRPANIWWDEGTYIDIGKYMYSGGESGFTESLRPILLPAIIGLFWKLGISPIIAGRAIAVMSSLALICMTYTLAKKAGDKNRAILSAALLAMTGYYLFFSTKILTGIPSTLLVAIAINETLKPRLTNKGIIIAGISSALAIMMRYTSMSLIAPVALAILIRSWSVSKNSHNPGRPIMDTTRALTLYATTLAVTVAPYFLYMRHLYGDPLYSIKTAMITIRLSVPYYTDTVTSLITGMLTNNPLLIFSLIGAVLYATSKDLSKNIILLEAIIACFSFLSIRIYVIRYTLIALPYLCILAASGIAHISEKLTKRQFTLPALKGTLHITVMIIIAVLSIQYISGNITTETYASQWDDIYGTIISTNITGPILVTDPSAGAYIDNRIIAFAGVEYANEIYDREIGTSSLILINTCDLQCLEGDTSCETRRQAFISRVESENTLIREEHIGECRIILFEVGR